jgi:ornithine cyclodeaminase/alanine dehydrogenase-like protein (mu-crystallin family)
MLDTYDIEPSFAGRDLMNIQAGQFWTISAADISRIVVRDRQRIFELVKETYRAFGNRRAFNPQSSFLTFTDIDERSPNRIIALPAYICGDSSVAGLKWISSFPGNLETGLPRASAILILNDMRTGFPYACMEGSLISAVRTAASAVLGADIVCRGDRIVRKIGFVGNGFIASTIFQFFEGLQWQFGEVGLFDLEPEYSKSFKTKISETFRGPVTISEDLESLIRSVDLLVLATTAGKPFIFDKRWFEPQASPHLCDCKGLGEHG